MQNVHIDYRGDALSYSGASLLAKGVARQNKMSDPTIMAWRRHDSADMSPAPYEGADPETWWEKYGAGNGGRMEISVGKEYCFILMDTRGYETVDQIPLRNLSDNQGNHYLCYTPLIGKLGGIPNMDACIMLDGWLADQY
jgi:hypothetical protein